jgi:hypothetical protein
VPRQAKDELEDDLNYDATILVQQTVQLILRLEEGSPGDLSSSRVIQGRRSVQEAYDRLSKLSSKAAKDALFRKKWTTQLNAAGRSGDDLMKRLEVLIRKFELLERNTQP